MPEQVKVKKGQARYPAYRYAIRAIFIAYATLMCYYTILTILIVREDVSMFTAEAIKQNTQKVEECQHHYTINFCVTQYAPALMEQCAAWAMCMNRDPSSVNRAALFAGYMGKVVDDFSQNMSFQTMVFFLVLCRVLTPLLHDWLAVGLLATL